MRSSRRLLRAAGAVVGLAGVAGCAGLFDGASSGDGTGTSDPAGDCETREDGEESGSGAAEGVATERELHAAHLRKSAAAARRARYPDAFDESVLDSARETADRVARSVVAFESPEADARWSSGANGSGWFRRPHEIVTNAHTIAGIRERDGTTLSDVTGVAENGDRFDVELVDSRQARGADVAVLRTDYEGTPLPTGESAGLTFEQPLVQVGHPVGIGDWTATLGRYAYGHGAVEDAGGVPDDLPEPSEDRFVSGVPARGGASGSPVTTLDGRVVGVTTSNLPMTEAERPPEPADPVVYDQPLARRTWTEHQSIEAIERSLDAE